MIFSVIKYIGVIYLLYLGLKSLFLKQDFGEDIIVKRESSYSVFIKGVLINLLNFKVVLFFLALLPQFVKPTSHPIEIMKLGIIFISFTGLWFLVVSLLSSKIGLVESRFPNFKSRISQASGVVMIALGLKKFEKELM